MSKLPIGLAVASLCLALSACGGGGGSNSSNSNTDNIAPNSNTNTDQSSNPPPIENPPPQTASNATVRFTALTDIAVDRHGTLYVIDDGSIRKMTNDGNVATVYQKGSVASSGNGSIIDARTLAIDYDGNVLVVDGNNVKRISTTGAISTLAMNINSRGRCFNTSNDSYTYNDSWVPPQSIVVDKAGNIYVNDFTNHAVKQITANGDISVLVKGQQDDSCTGRVEGLSSPIALAFDNSGILQVSNHIMLWKIENGMANPTINTSAIWKASLTFDPNGNSYGVVFSSGKTSAGHHVIKTTPDGISSHLASSYQQFNTGTPSNGPLKLNVPTDVVYSPDGNLYVINTGIATIVRVTLDGKMNVIAGAPGLY